MPVFNFQKPDKVIMIDSSEFEGKFEFRPLEPGYGLTVGNALPTVKPYPGSRGLNSNLPSNSDESIIITLSGF